jgi:TolB protein
MNNARHYENPVLFTSAGRIGVIEADGTSEKYFDFGVPGQASWGIGSVFKDNKKIVLMSYEDTTISKMVAGLVISHVWIYDLSDGTIEEILTEGRTSNYIGCAGIMDDGRILWTEWIEGENRLFISGLSGKGRYELTTKGGGFVYGIRLSPDSRRVSFHITCSDDPKYGIGPYSINTIGTDGSNRTFVAGRPGHICFEPVWSPDGEWLAYVDCYEEKDSAHFAADICLGRPDGSEHRSVTENQSNWFGTSYGTEKNRGNGSNGTLWSPDGKELIYTRLIPGSHADFYFDAGLPNHEEHVYKPELARGGTQICLINPFTYEIKELTEKQEGKWECHACYSQGGTHIIYRRSHVGNGSELWIMEKDGKNQRLLTKGYENKGLWGYGFANNRLEIIKN